jgi:hypothetical protein
MKWRLCLHFMVHPLLLLHLSYSYSDMEQVYTFVNLFLSFNTASDPLRF